ncbi:uncharacterized protein with HEPN domain [Methanomicrobium sp. W14]|uniref:HepT-like ribonuclease domain-containing protein n=1 Tax=Methanomicrobium sp. W14 TaxID=2817839 RepID=UPI001AEACFAE|nr:DUF86 domain-containing protein [Methanomicrobium sp. W14]MBP2133236.1 uncharacterized protein with HEPN domain [Methanomicrobium sp. W14]
MSKRDVLISVDDIIEAAERISDYIKYYSKEDFETDQKTIDAVVRNIEIIGEAASNIPEDFRCRYPQIPWKRIVGTRNIVIHKYFGVDTGILWFIIQKQLPELKLQMIKMIHNIEEKE